MLLFVVARCFVRCLMFVVYCSLCIAPCFLSFDVGCCLWLLCGLSFVV